MSKIMGLTEEAKERMSFGHFKGKFYWTIIRFLKYCPVELDKN